MYLATSYLSIYSERNLKETIHLCELLSEIVFDVGREIFALLYVFHRDGREDRRIGNVMRVCCFLCMLGWKDRWSGGGGCLWMWYGMI